MFQMAFPLFLNPFGSIEMCQPSHLEGISLSRVIGDGWKHLICSNLIERNKIQGKRCVLPSRRRHHQAVMIMLE